MLLHGLNGHSGTWRNNVPYFSGSWYVVAPSLPTWKGPAEALDIGQYVGYTNALLNGLGIQEYSVIGNSMGGWIGMRLVELRGSSVKKLVLEDSAGLGRPADEQAIEAVKNSRTKVLIIWGRNDHVLPVNAARYLQSKIESSELVIFENAGHVPHWQVSEEFNRTAKDFLMK